MSTKERLIIESMFMIPNKAGKDVPFLLNKTQARLDQHLTGRDIVPKARQEGVSSYFLGRYTVKCLAERNTRAVVISHDKESTQRMLSKVHYFLDNIRGAQPVIKNDSKNELSFPKTNSLFYIGTAGARKFGRGDTITHLHCSEAAFWEDAKGLTAGLFQAVPSDSGEIAIESTGNGVGNWYHKRCLRAAEGKSRYRMHFFNWLEFPEYTHILSQEQENLVLATLDPDLEEPKLVEQGLTPGQLSWRREKLEDMDFDMRQFKQEYPMDLAECFQATGHSIFHKVLYDQTDMWKREGEFSWLEGHPIAGHHYAVGCDVGAGVGRNNSVIEVIDLVAMEQVGEWVSDRIGPDILADHLVSVGNRFNGAFLVVEANNHGIVTLARLRDIYPSHLIYKDDSTAKDKLMSSGFRTTARSRPLMIGKLRMLLSSSLVIHSPLLMSELSTFVEKEDGKLEAEGGCMDDRVIAIACGAVGLERASLMLVPAPPLLIQAKDPFSLEGIIDELHGKGRGFPIRPQAACGA